MARDRPQTSLRNCEESDVIPHGRETSFRGEGRIWNRGLEGHNQENGFSGGAEGF